jgi:hypothetical protein
VASARDPEEVEALVQFQVAGQGKYEKNSIGTIVLGWL